MTKKMPLLFSDYLKSDVSSSGATWMRVPDNFVPFAYTACMEYRKEYGKKILIVCSSEDQALAIYGSFNQIASVPPVYFFPARDALPYDRSASTTACIAERLRILSLIRSNCSHDKGMIVVTVSEVLRERLPPPASLEAQVLHLSVGKNIDRETLIHFCVHNGYHRVDVVREAGEFAIRGSIFDLFSAQAEHPVRVDFFDDTIESLRSFEALSQKTFASLETLLLAPIAEIQFQEENKKIFKRQYLKNFGAQSYQDPLYKTVEQGEIPAAAEHWLPLFFEETATLQEYMQPNFLLYDGQVLAALEHFQQQVEDHFQARVQAIELHSSFSSQQEEYSDQESLPLYRPLDPNVLYAPSQTLEHLKKEVSCYYIFTAFLQEHGIDYGFQVFSDVHTKKGLVSTLEFLLKYTKEVQKPVVMCGTAKALSAYQQALETLSITFVCMKDLSALAGKQSGFFLWEWSLDESYTHPKAVFIAQKDLLDGSVKAGQKGRAVRKFKNLKLELSAFEAEDYVVHKEHGVGQFIRLQTLTVNGITHDCLEVLYAQGGKLYVPVEQIDLLKRYGRQEGALSLDRLGSPAWQTRKAKAKKDLLRLAQQLVDRAAEREEAIAPSIMAKTEEYKLLDETFPYVLTSDQETAVAEILENLEMTKPMDRLLCGDVGFGKTEVALRAAFVTVKAGYQVLLLVPTTLLAQQHTTHFTKRLQDFSIKVGHLSRLVPLTERKKTLQLFQEGKIHILISTHSILSQAQTFKQVGLCIIDEEQHFGVKQKERLKELQKGSHVLTLTATPIPRTLQLSLAGIRGLSLLATPPVDRLAVHTFVTPMDDIVIQDAMRRELHRSGQVFYVSSRIKDLEHIVQRVKRLVPEARLAVAHGQMSPQALEDIMMDFYEGDYNVLISTNIIESGLDVQRANTLIVHRSDRFGLSQLYQLRGRVGRSKQRGYAYFTVPTNHNLTQKAQKRLEIIQGLEGLGAGFSLASYDLDMRGAGNILGEEQSGHIKEIGIELYQEMLEDTLSQLKGKDHTLSQLPQDFSPQITLNWSAFIPEEYIPDIGLRLGLYRRLGDIKNLIELKAFEEEAYDRFGPIPKAMKQLLHMVYLKILCLQAAVEKLDIGEKGMTISFYQNTFPNVEDLLTYIQKNFLLYHIQSDQKIIYKKALENPTCQYEEAVSVLETLSVLAQKVSG